MAAVMRAMLRKVKANLIFEHDEDDSLLLDMISAAIAYAEDRQHKPAGHYLQWRNKMRPTTERAIIVLTTHFYESRDGSTGGFFNDKVDAGAQVWKTVNNLLSLNKDVIF